MGILPALVVLTVAFLSAEAYTLFIAAEGLVPTHKAFSAFSVSDFPAALLLDITWFAVVVVLLHALVIIYALAVRRFLVRRRQWRRDRADGVALLVFLGLWAAVVLWNGILYPRSHFVFTLGSDSLDRLLAITCLLLASVPLLLLAADAWRWLFVRSLPRSAAVIVVISLAAILLFLQSRQVAPVVPSPNAPNIVLIGVDSLRPEYVLEPQWRSVMPHLAAMVSDSAWFGETVTPLGRTYPSWMSILSGRYPLNSGARMNLVDPDRVDRTGLLSQVLQRQGYRTVLAIDERRFSNIDETYGFDKVIGPEAGAADFVMGLAGDLPIVNLLAATPIGGSLFPYLHANRAVAATYRPAVFDRELDQALADRRSDRPLFLAAHYCLPHWPYHWAEKSGEGTAGIGDQRDLANERRRLYEDALRAADNQVGRLVETLGRNGYLDNALIVLLSDHGESFGPDDLPMLAGEDDAPVLKHSVGHGTNVFVPSQHRILLAFTGTGEFQFEPGPRRQPAATLDIFPTVAGLLGLPDPEHVEGISLAPWLLFPQQAVQSRHFFIETGFNVPALSTVNFNLEKLLEQGASFYEIDDGGRLVVNEAFRQKIVAGKQLGVTNGRITVGAVADEEGTRHWYRADLSVNRIGLIDSSVPGSCGADCLDLLARLAQFYVTDLSASDHAFVVSMLEGNRETSSANLAVSAERRGPAGPVLAASEDSE